MKTNQALPRLCLLLALAGLPLQVLAGKNATELAPLPAGPTQVEFSAEQTSKWTDQPIGTYRVPNSDVVISGHQKQGASPFGLIGMAVQNSIDQGKAKRAMADAEQALTFSIDEEAKAKLLVALADPAYAGKFTSAATDPKLQLIGSVVLSFAQDQEVLPYVTLRVKLMGNGGKSKLWTTRYIASKGARRPLTGDGSWTANGGAELRTHVGELLDMAISTMLKDVATPYPRDEASLVTVRGFFPHVKQPLQVVGYKLGEENGRMLFLPKLGTSIVFAGVNILDTASVWQQPTAKGDKGLKVLKANDPTIVALMAPAAAPVAAPAVVDAAAPAATEPNAAGIEAPGAEAATTGEEAIEAEPATTEEDAVEEVPSGG